MGIYIDWFIRLIHSIDWFGFLSSDGWRMNEWMNEMRRESLQSFQLTPRLIHSPHLLTRLLLLLILLWTMTADRYDTVLLIEMNRWRGRRLELTSFLLLLVFIHSFHFHLPFHLPFTHQIHTKQSWHVWCVWCEWKEPFRIRINKQWIPFNSH